MLSLKPLIEPHLPGYTYRTQWVPILELNTEKDVLVIALIASLSLLSGLALRTQTGVSFLGLDNHELAHFFGAFGLATLLVLALGREVLMHQANSGLAALVGVTAGSYATETWLAPYAWKFHAPYVAIAWRYLVLVVVFAAWLRFLDFVSRFVGDGAQGRWPMAIVLAIPVCFSLGWELMWQPYIGVYGAAARGGVQWGQLLADQVACVLAWLVVRHVAINSSYA